MTLDSTMLTHMDSALEAALVSASIAAVVSVSVAVISPLFTHHLWKRQKRKEQQLVVAERFTVLSAETMACAELEALREHQKRMTAVWGRHLHPDSALRLEADFTLDPAVRLLDRHRYWCAKCRNRAK
jgi:hypothetical protein